MICPVEIARDLSAWRVARVRVGDHGKHGFLLDAAGADVHIEDMGLSVMHLVLVKHRVLGGVHAADFAAVGQTFGIVAGAHATDKHHTLRNGAVRRPLENTAGGAESRNQSLKLERVNDIFVLPVAVLAVTCQPGFILFFGNAVELVSGGHDDGANTFLDQLVLILEVNGFGLALFLAQLAAIANDSGANLLLDNGPCWDSLREWNVDCRSRSHAEVEFARILLQRANVPALTAAGALGGVDVASLLPDRNLEIAYEPINRFDFRIGVQLDARMLSDLDHPRREDALPCSCCNDARPQPASYKGSRDTWGRPRPHSWRHGQRHWRVFCEPDRALFLRCTWSCPRRSTRF